MKLKKRASYFFSKKSRQFLVLPPLENKEDKENIENMSKPTGLRLFTKTWNAKLNRKEKHLERPLTATLTEPAVLDIRFISSLDMSTIRKEFLNITNICKFPLRLKVRKNQLIARPLSVAIDVKKEHSEDSWEDEESVIGSVENNKTSGTLKKSTVSKLNVKKKIPSVKSNDKNNNNKLKNSKVEKTKENNLPEPCNTCGRSNHPERFHSHPETPLKPLKKQEEEIKIPVKNTVQKPVAIKYKSKNISNIKKPSVTRKPSLPYQKVEHSPPSTASVKKVSPRIILESKALQRSPLINSKVICYVCGREFSSQALMEHETKCLEKWEKENRNLPYHLQKATPRRPSINSSNISEWNKKVSNTFESSLLPCKNCGRTFNPNSLVIHQRSCREKVNPANVDHQNSSPIPSSPLNSECNICYKKFSQRSLKIHQPQCLKKLQLQNVANNEKNKRSAHLNKGNKCANVMPELSPNNVKVGLTERTSSGRGPSMLPCYLCGRLFSINSISIHEPQCLKMWRVENEKLPSAKRRAEPKKPAYILSKDGKIDFEATSEDVWQVHLKQLVACKICLRTFNPDRVEIHEKNCKG